MRKLITIFLTFVIFILGSCNNNSQVNKQKELELKNKQKELQLKQRDLGLKEKELEILKTSKQAPKRDRKTNADNKKKKELRYLFYANGGMVGYFNDGTIAGCPRCDFCKTNIKAT